MTVKKPDMGLPESPFPGINPFNYADRTVFFAREQESRSLIRLVVIHRGVLLYSDSGTGKSSLINAGLLPHAVAEGLQPEKIRVQPRLDEEIIVERLSDNTRASPALLPSMFSADADEERVVLSVSTFLTTLQKNAHSSRPLLIFDQFEEWFTLFEEGARGKRAKEAQTAQGNIRDAILSLLLDSELPVKILLVLREDYLAKLTPFFQRYPNLPDQYLRLTALKGADIKRIIRGPFEEYAGKYQPEIPATLAQKIRAEFESRSEGEPVRLSEVQIVCRTLYECARGSDELEHYFTEQGGVQGILEQYLRSALESLPKRQRDPAVGLLSRMVTAAGTRNVISHEDVISRVENEDGISRNILNQTLDSLEQESKLVRRERRREVYYYEIASEFLVAWIRAKASQRAERLEVEAAERALREERKKAREQADIAAKLRRRAIAMAVFFVIVLLSVGLLFLSWRKTKEAEKVAEFAELKIQQEKNARKKIESINEKLAEANVKKDALNDTLRSLNLDLTAERNKAEDLRQEAVENLREIKRLRHISQARNLAILAPLQQDQKQSRVDTIGALLAQQAYRYNQDNREKFPDEIYQALHATLNTLNPNAGGPVFASSHHDWARAVTFGKNGEVASGGADGRIIVWKVIGSEFEPDQLVQMGNRTAASDSTAHKGSVRSLIYSPDGKILASCGDDRIVRLWYRNRNTALTGHRGGVWLAAFSPDGRLLASGGADSTIIVWRLATATDGKISETQWTRNQGARVRQVAFNATGNMLASAGDDGWIILWHVRGNTLTRAESLSNSTSVRAIAFNPNALQLVAGLKDGTLWLWDLTVAGRPEKQRIFKHADLINAVAFSRTGDMFASASADESVGIWTWASRKFGPVVLRDHKSWVWSLAFNQAGDRLVTGGSDNTIRVWVTHARTLSRRLCAKINGTLSFAEWQKYVGNEEEGFPYQPSCAETKQATSKQKSKNRSSLKKS